jgi:alpha/beta superfamily hydrolase
LKLPREQRLLLAGPAGNLETVVNDPGDIRRGLALIAHPHPLYGGTLDNKVVQTLAKAFFAQGCVTVRMNFRGVGGSDGVFDEGVGETEDWLQVAHAVRTRFGELPLTLAGFSFGAFVQSRVAAQLGPERLVLVAPAVGRFAVERVPVGTLVIHGEEDDVVPLRDVLDWARPQTLPVVVLPGAGHFFHGNLIELARIVQNACPCPTLG